MSLDEERWEARLEELRKFRREHGHCEVPHRRPGGLGIWVTDQRQARKRRKGWLDARRIRKLDEEGFRWAVIEDKWDARLEELKEFRKEHGHCDVPQRIPGLGRWVKHQRQARRQGKGCLDPRRIRLLEEEGFQWRAGRGHGTSGGLGGNEQEDGRGGDGAAGWSAPEKERGDGSIPAEETRASRGGLGEQGSVAEALRGEKEGRSRENASERASRAVDELVKSWKLSGEKWTSW